MSRAALLALGFVHEEGDSSYHLFSALPSVLESIDTTGFGNFPNLPDNEDKKEGTSFLAPKNDAEFLSIKEETSQHLKKPTFKVTGLKVESATFSISPGNKAAIPEFEVNIGYDFDPVYVDSSSSNLNFRYSLDETSLLKTGPADKSLPLSITNPNTIASNTSRCIATSANFVSLASNDEISATEPSLAIELTPNAVFQPNKEFPLTVSMSNNSLLLRLNPSDGRLNRDLELRLNPLEPCLSVTVQGPMIHAESQAGIPSEWQKFLEPVERQVGDSVERINEFLNYTFELCLPREVLKGLTFPDIKRLDGIGVSFGSIKDFPKVPIAKFLDKFAFPELALENYVIDKKKVTFTLDKSFNEQWFQGTVFEKESPLDNWWGNKDWWDKHLKFPTRSESQKIETLEVKFENGQPTRISVTSNSDFPKVGSYCLDVPGIADFQYSISDFGLPSLSEFRTKGIKLDGSDKVLAIDDPPEIFQESIFGEASQWRCYLRNASGGKTKLALENIKFSNNQVTLKDDLDVEGELSLTFQWFFTAISQKENVVLLDDNFLKCIKRLAGNNFADARLFKLCAKGTDEKASNFGISKIENSSLFLSGSQQITDKELELVSDLSFPLTKCNLSDLFGDLPNVDFRLSLPESQVSKFRLPEIAKFFGGIDPENKIFGFGIGYPVLPFQMILRVPNPVRDPKDWDELTVTLGVQIDLANGRLLSNKIYFFLPQINSISEICKKNTFQVISDNYSLRQVIDFDLFTVTFPSRPITDQFPNESNHDGYLDLSTREFVVDLKYQDLKNGTWVSRDVTPPPRIKTYFPGGMDRCAARLGRDAVEQLGEDDQNKKTYRREYVKRFELELDSVDPALWPADGPNPLSFRFSQNGMTLAANVSKTEVEVDSNDFNDDGTLNNPKRALIKPFKFVPQEKQGELKSRLVIIDNELREASVFAKTEVPGVDNLIAEVGVSLRQEAKGRLPDVIASMELERSDEAPVAELSIKLLELTLERIALALKWRREEKEWDYSAIADGTIAFTGAASIAKDLEELRTPKIKLIGLDLRKLNLREMRIPIDLVEPVRFDILDKLFAVELGDLELAWVFEDKMPKLKLIKCELAKLEFKKPGSLEVSVSVGGFHIEFDENLRASIKLPSSLGIEVALSTTAKFAGHVGWVEKPNERYLFASGKVMLQGLPEISGLLKFGTGRKTTGRNEINLVLYGAMELDKPLFTGAVAKSLGLGVGLNNRLSAFPSKPSADAIVSRIDSLKPGEISGWQFVEEGGFYLSIIGSALIGSTQGKSDVLQSYLAQLVVSFDTNLDLIAAGKVWLSTSLDGQRKYPNNPAFVGAMVLSPSQKKLELVLESRKDPYVEKNDLMKKLLSKTKVRFAFRMTPQLVDYHMSELSYRDTMYGVDMAIVGEYRFAIFKRAVLLKSELSATGVIERNLTAGPGGFDMKGKAWLAYGYGGLLTQSGAMAYAFIDAGLRFEVSAWIEIVFSISIRVCGKKKTWSWTVRYGTRTPELDLTFRGGIGMSDRGGLIGTDVQVGINISICGYRLRASGRLDINGELYHEVREQVAAFENELQQAVKKLDQTSPSGENVQASKGIASSSVKTEGSLDSANGTKFKLNMERGSRDELGTTAGVDASNVINATQSQKDVILSDLSNVASKFRSNTESVQEACSKTIGSERWLLYRRRNKGNKRVETLVPADGTPWLTPRMATISSVNLFRLDDTILGIKLNAPNHGLKIGSVVPLRLFGLRGKSDSGKLLPESLNRSWEKVKVLNEHSLSIIISIHGHLKKNDGGEDNSMSITSIQLESDLAENDKWIVKTACPGTGNLSEGDSVNLSLESLEDTKWKVKSACFSEVELVPQVSSDLASKPFVCYGGIWRKIDDTFETSQGLDASDEDSVHFLNEVERVLILDESKKRKILEHKILTNGDSKRLQIKLEKDHGFENPIRMCVLDDSGDLVSQHIASENSLLFRTKYKNLFECKLSNALTKKQLEGLAKYVAPAIEIAPTWNAANRREALKIYDPNDQVPEGWDKDEFIRKTAAASAWAETARKSNDDLSENPDHSAFAVVFDERLESDDPRFSPAGISSSLPDGVLSTRLENPEDTAVVGADAILDSAVRFKKASDELRRQEMHDALNLPLGEALHQRRAQAVGLLVNRLSNTNWSGSDQHEEAPIVDVSEGRIGYGWLWQANSLSNDSQHIIYVKRQNSEFQKVDYDIIDSGKYEELKGGVSLLPVRQEFVIDKDTPGAEESRVIVKLPIRFDDEILRKDLHKIGLFEVYRQIGNYPPELIGSKRGTAGPCRPEVSFLNTPQVYSVEHNGFVPDHSNAGYRFKIKGAIKDFTITIDRERELPSQCDGFACRLFDANGTEFCRLYRIKSHNETSIQLEGTPKFKTKTPPTHFEIVAAGLIVPRPYLISDEFDVQNRKFTDPSVVDSKDSSGVSYVKYALRFVNESDAGSPLNLEAEKRSGQYIEWNHPSLSGVPLHIPSKVEFPKRLAMALDVNSMVEGEELQFQLVSLSEQFPKLASQNEKPLSSQDFEIYLSSESLRQSGFYAGDSGDDRKPEATIDNQSLTFADMENEPPIETISNKDLLPCKSKATNGCYETDLAKFHWNLKIGRQYQAYIRSSNNPNKNTEKLVTRLPILLVRGLPAKWDENTRFKQTESIEMIPKTHWEKFEKKEAVPALEDVSVDDLYRYGRNIIQTVWPSDSVLSGGAEIQFRDFDDSVMRDRQLVEIVASEEFQKNPQDFRDESFWTLSSNQRFERFSQRTITSKPDQKQIIFEDYFVLKEKDEQNSNFILQEIKRLNEAIKRVDDLGNWKDEGYSIVDVANVCRLVQAALIAFEKGPLNFRNPIVRAHIAAVRICMRSMLTGLEVLDPNGGRKPEEELRQLLRRIDDLPIPKASEEDDLSSFIDRDASRTLSGIVRRRLQIADEVASLTPMENSPTNRSYAVSSSSKEIFPLALEKQWQEELEDISTLNVDTPILNELKQRVNNDAAKTALEKCVKKLGELKVSLETDLETLSKKVTRAAGLTKFLSQLESILKGNDQDSLAGILKRPHHELATTMDEQSGEITTQETPLRSLLPPEVRSVKPGTIPPLPDESLTKLASRVWRFATLGNGKCQIWTIDTASVSSSNAVRRITEFAEDGSDIQLADGPDGPLVATFNKGVVSVRNAADAKLSFKISGVASGVQFAMTQRQLELAYVKGNTTELRGLDPNAEPSKFTITSPSQNIEYKIAGPPCYCEESQMIATPSIEKKVNGNQVVDHTSYLVIWRDLGQTKNEIPFKKIRLGNTDCKNITEGFIKKNCLSVVLPNGPRFIIVGEYTVHIVDPFISLASANEAPCISFDGNLIVDVAIDRRNLQLILLLKGEDDTKLVKWDMLSGDNCEIELQDSGAGEPISVSTISVSTISVGNSDDAKTFALVAFGNHATPDSNDPEGLESQQAESGNTLLVDLSTDSTVPRTVIPTGPITSTSSSLQLARTSTSSQGITSLFHLWERMGFAVDIAAQDSTKRLLPFAELHRLIDVTYSSLDPSEQDGLLSVVNKDHYVFAISAEEQGAEYRKSYRQGFAHAKVAVVPKDFIDASLDESIRAGSAQLSQNAGDENKIIFRPNFDQIPENLTVVFLDGPLKGKEKKVDEAAGKNGDLLRKYFTIDVHDDLPKDGALIEDDLECKVIYFSLSKTEEELKELKTEEELKEESFCALEKWLKHREVMPNATNQSKLSVEGLIELMHVSHLTRMVALNHPSRFGIPQGQKWIPEPTKIYLEPKSERFIKKPAIANFTGATWTLPDLKGHRIMAAVRKVSRYEPLMRWWKQVNTRFDLPENEIIAEESVLLSQENRENTVEFSNEPPPPSGRQPVVLEVVSGPAKGQRREGFLKGTTFTFESGDPWLGLDSKEMKDEFECRLIDAAPGWQMVEIQPVHDPSKGEGSQALKVYQYPHSRNLRFSYQIPLDGMRAIYNQISRVRTGYHGVEIANRYYLPERPQPSKPALQKILECIVGANSAETNASQTSTMVPSGNEPIVRLFRHERMETLPEHPFYYRYRMDVRSVYRARRLEHDRITAAEMLPEDDYASPPAERLPASLTMARPFIRKESELEIDVKLLIPTNRDHLTREELLSEPFPITCEFKLPMNEIDPKQIDIESGDLPDFVSDILLSKVEIPGTGPLPNKNNIFSSLGAVRLPHSPEHKTLSDFPKVCPYVSLASGYEASTEVATVALNGNEKNIAHNEMLVRLYGNELGDESNTIRLRLLASDSPEDKRFAINDVEVARGVWIELRATDQLENPAQQDVVQIEVRNKDRKIVRPKSSIMPLVIEYKKQDGKHYWQVAFRIHAISESMAIEPKKVFTQLLRLGSPSRAINTNLSSESGS